MKSRSLRSRFGLLDPRVAVIYAVLLGYVLWPIVLVLSESIWKTGEGLTFEPWRQFAAQGHWVYALRSLGISIATVLIAGIFGTSLAFFYGRFEFPGRRLFSALSLLPFTLPPLVGVFAIWTLMAEDGPVDKITGAIFGRGLWFEKGMAGILLVHVYSMFVYFFVMVGEALNGFDESQIEAARDLGAGRWTTFFRVVLPQLFPALAGASLLTFMTSMASFTAPFFYMPGRPVLTLGIVQAMEQSQYGLVGVDCFVLAVSAGIFLYFIVRFEQTFEGGSKGVARERMLIRSPLLRIALFVLAAFLTLMLVAPHLSMLHESFIRPGTGMIGKPLEYGLVSYQKIWNEPRNWSPIANSLSASAAATLAVIAFTLLSSWMEARREYFGKESMRWLLMLPWALPGTVIGVGLLWMTRSPNVLTAGRELRGTITILALAYFIRLFPLSHRTIRSSLLRVPLTLEGAARDLGASPLQAFARVTMPLIFPAVAAAATLVFVTAMGEFVSSILLKGLHNEPISVRIDQLRSGPAGMQMAAAYSTMLMLMITLTFLIFGRPARRAT